MKIKTLFTKETSICMGEEAVFDEIYRNYFAPLCYFAQKLIDVADAEDVVNTLFLKLWRQKETFISYQHVQATLYKATRHACLNHLKLSKRAEERHRAVMMEVSDNDKDFIHHMIRTEVWAEIYREVNRLPVQCARVITLSFIEGLKNDAIAEKLHISVQTVKNQKSMGVKLLKKRLTKISFFILLVPFDSLF